MHLDEIRQALDDLRNSDSEGDGPEDTLTLVMAKLGQMATSKLQLDGALGEQMPDDHVDDLRRDLFAGIILAAVDWAVEHGIDPERAIEERLERMQAEAEKRKEIQEAVEAKDAKALADALDADQNEVPTGMFDEEEDGDEPRGFQ